MLPIPADIFTEPNVSLMIGQLGPLRTVGWMWEAIKASISHKGQGSARPVFREHVGWTISTHRRTDPNFSIASALYTHQHPEKITVPRSVGYWLWAPAMA